MTLSELNTRYARAKARLAAARLANEQAALTVASAELVKLDEAIATVLAEVALRNADLGRQRSAAA
jgi:hypothetical protein